MKIAHLTTVDMSLRYLVLPQLEESLRYGESIGISAPGEYVPELEERGIRHVPLTASTRGMSLLSDLRAMGQLWKVLRDEDIDILHTHNPKPGLYGRVIGRLAGVPIVVNTVHGLYATEDSSLAKRAVVYSTEFFASRFSDAELIQSPEDMSLLSRLHITPRARTRLLGNGVDLERFNPANANGHRDSVRKELEVASDQVVVGMVGRLVDEKGVPELIEAASLLDDRYVVAIVGPHDPEKDDAVSPETIALGEKSGVRFLGMRRDVERLYGGFDIFVLPSHREGFPRAAMEAAASGLPVIATDIRGCRQVVDDGVNGYLFPVRDIDALRSRIEAIGGDKAHLEDMGKASVDKAGREFDEKRVVERVFDTYRSVAVAKGYSWALDERVADIELARARSDDVSAVARLHQRMIGTGFLSSLGMRFLTVLYGALVADSSSAVLVARDDETVVGFIAGTADTGGFYRRFLRSYLLPAVVALLPVLFKPSQWRRIYESLRYGGESSEISAELLSMAVAPVARRRGLGSRLVDALLDWTRANGIDEMKVIVGDDNPAAIGLYQSCGFANPSPVAVHDDAPSLELVWSG